MIRFHAGAILAIAACSAVVDAVEFEWAQVGNAGNAADPETGRGSVPYNYAIATTEVTNAQYAAFLNAVDPTGANSLALYNPKMAGDSGGPDGSYGGIEASGTADGAHYVAKAGREQNPVSLVSFLDAMRFTNWLHNGQGAGGTESGAYTIGNGLDEVRSSNARYWIPSEDEWYKAAYHDATAGTAGVYFDYATSSDETPISDQPSDNPAAVNYWYNDGIANGFNDGLAVSGSSPIPPGTTPYTDVGSYTAARSPYGTFDQNGNVWEWNETVVRPSDGEIAFDGPWRAFRGGAWFAEAIDLSVGMQFANLPSFESSILGFRVATVPEPSGLLMVSLAGTGVMLRRRAGRRS